MSPSVLPVADMKPAGEDVEYIQRLSTPFEREPLLQLRTGKIKPLYSLPVTSAIYKTVQNHPVKITKRGCEGDEQAYEFHGGPDKALLQYCSQHYDRWKTECPGSASRFEIGGFGENLVATVANERNVCIGDIISIGNDVLVQVSLPRQPCFKLNHRFQVKDMALRSQTHSRTGWYYRVLKEGYIRAGDEMALVGRPNPKWSIYEVQKYLHRDMKNFPAMRELVKLPELGEEARTIFQNRLQRKFENPDDRLVGDESVSMSSDVWSNFRLVEKRAETPLITSLFFEALEPSNPEYAVAPGSHVRLQLGQLVRSYSIVSGTKSRFQLGVALQPNSRGGSRYLHETIQVGQVIPMSRIDNSFPLVPDADEHIMVAGGIGITAFLAAAEQLQQSDQKFELYIATSSRNNVPFKNILQRLSPNRVIIYDKSKGQRLDIKQIISKMNTGTHIYCCGPSRLMDAVSKTADECGVPKSQVHFETFSATTGDPFTAELAVSKETLEVPSSKSLLEVLREAGIDVPSSCEVGNCGTCRVDVIEGKVDHKGSGLLDSDKDCAMLSCVSRGVGKIVLGL